MSKLGFLAGFGAGYVLGARAGRQRYDQLAGKAQELWRDPRVQRKASQAQGVAGEKASQAAGLVGEKVSQAAGAVQESVKDRVSGHDGDDGNGAGIGNGPTAAGPGAVTPAAPTR